MIVKKGDFVKFMQLDRDGCVKGRIYKIVDGLMNVSYNGEIIETCLCDKCVSPGYSWQLVTEQEMHNIEFDKRVEEIIT